MDPWINLQFVTRALSLSAEAQNVYLFGSTARQLRDFVGDYAEFGPMPDPDNFAPTSNDLDLVVTVPEDVYEAWNRMLIRRLRECKMDCSTPQDVYHGCKWVRFNLALELLGCGSHHYVMPLLGWLTTLDSIKEIDVHLMPAEWRKQIPAVQDHLPHKDPNFVSNIARDAINLTETDPSNIIAWQEALVRQISRKKQVVDSIRRGAVISTLLSVGHTTKAGK